MSKIKERINSIERGLSNLKSTDNSVKIIAVSKKKSSKDIKEAFEAGISNFGENYLQEALGKINELKDLGISWHFVGKIQSNKCKEIAENFNWVHTIDRYKVASLLEKYCPKNKIIYGLIQVNIDDEDTKSGIAPEEVKTLLKELKSLKKIKIIGLMIIPAINVLDEEAISPFARIKKLLLELQEENPNLKELSMGMSQDYEMAIKEGSTIVRLGESIFGKREKK